VEVRHRTFVRVRSTVELIDPRNDLHEGGFAGAIFAQKRVRFTRVELDGTVGECHHRPKRLGDILQDE